MLGGMPIAGIPRARARARMTVGYRFWVVRPGEDLLLSPYVAPPVEGVNVVQASEIALRMVTCEDYGPPWLSTRMVATCSKNPRHRPPAPGCLCGVYADRTPELAQARAQRHRASVEANLMRAWRRGFAVPPYPSYVVGAVELTDAVLFAPPPPMFRVADDELRAASAEIVALLLPAASDDPQLVERLAQRYRKK